MANHDIKVASSIVAQSLHHVRSLHILCVRDVPTHRLELLRALVALGIPTLVIDAAGKQKCRLILRERVTRSAQHCAENSTKRDKRRSTNKGGLTTGCSGHCDLRFVLSTQARIDSECQFSD